MGWSIHQYQDEYLEYSLSRWDIHINFFDLFSFTALDEQSDFGGARAQFCYPVYSNLTAKEKV